MQGNGASDPFGSNKALLNNPPNLAAGLPPAPRYTPPPQRTVKFTIGGEEVDVPELHWDILEDHVLPLMDQIGGTDDDRVKLAQLRDREAALKLQPQTADTVAETEQNQREQIKLLPRWYVSRSADIKILAAALQDTRPDLTYETIRKRLTLDEARQVSERMVDLLRISGFTVNQGESQAAGDSTATSIDSSPNSLLAESPPSQTGNAPSEA